MKIKKFAEIITNSSSELNFHQVGIETIKFEKSSRNIEVERTFDKLIWSFLKIWIYRYDDYSNIIFFNQNYMNDLQMTTSTS